MAENTFLSFVKDIFEASKDRIKTPITGAYSLAFILYNWRPILFLLFSNQSIETKIDHIDTNYCNWGAILWPFAIAIAYSLLVPYLMMIIELKNKEVLFDRKDYQVANKQKDLENLGKLLRTERVNEDIRSGNLEKQELNDEIKALKSQQQHSLEQHRSTINNYEKIIQNFRDNNNFMNEVRPRAIPRYKSYEEFIDNNLEKIQTIFEDLNTYDIIALNTITQINSVDDKYKPAKEYVEKLIKHKLIQIVNYKDKTQYVSTQLGNIVNYYIAQNYTFMNGIYIKN